MHKHKQASPIGPSTPTKEASDAVWPKALDSTQALDSNQGLSKASSNRADSVWEPPAIAWSASGSSLLTAHKLDSSATGISSFNESGSVTADNVSKTSFDTQPMSVATSMKGGQAMRRSTQQDMLEHSTIHSTGKTPASKNKGWKKIAAWFVE